MCIISSVTHVNSLSRVGVPLVPMIVTTGAGTRGHNYCVELHWHLSFHKFDVKNFSDRKKKHNSFDMKRISREYRIIA